MALACMYVYYGCDNVIREKERGGSGCVCVKERERKRERERRMVSVCMYV